jgi:hypothetical protein
LRQIGFRVNNYFGQQVLTDWSGFKLFGLRKPKNVDNWNVDIDYLSYRGFALGSEIGYFGGDLSSDILKRDLFPGVAGKYFGYLDFWGLVDEGNDNLGGGPAVVTVVGTVAVVTVVVGSVTTVVTRRVSPSTTVTAPCTSLRAR